MNRIDKNTGKNKIPNSYFLRDSLSHFVELNVKKNKAYWRQRFSVKTVNC